MVSREDSCGDLKALDSLDTTRVQGSLVNVLGSHCGVLQCSRVVIAFLLLHDLLIDKVLLEGRGRRGCIRGRDRAAICICHSSYKAGRAITLPKLRLLQFPHRIVVQESQIAEAVA